jgi:prepilin-type N-terminal cleavage/methylation domain-containing protein
MVMNYRKNSTGFTLIELLVVIAIIALLSSVVLASLNSARTKAADNSVKTAMKQMVNQAEIYRDLNPDFGSSSQTGVAQCNQGVFSDSRILSMQANIAVNAGIGATFTCYTDAATRTKWALSISLLRSGGSWCVDNSSAFRATTAQNTGLCS